MKNKLLIILIAVILVAALTLAISFAGKGDKKNDGNTNSDGVTDENPDGGNDGVNNSTGDGTEGDGTEGDGTEGDGTEGDGTEGDGTEGDGTEGDGTEGDGTEGDGTEGGEGEGLYYGFCIRCGWLDPELSVSEGLEFTPNGDGSCYLSGMGTCSDVIVVVPETSPDGLKVTAIGDRAFAGNDKIGVIIAVGEIESIGKEAFADCPNLYAAYTSEKVVSVG